MRTAWDATKRIFLLQSVSRIRSLHLYVSAAMKKQLQRYHKREENIRPRLIVLIVIEFTEARVYQSVPTATLQRRNRIFRKKIAQNAMIHMHPRRSI